MASIKLNDMSFRKALERLANAKNGLAKKIDDTIGARMVDMETSAKSLAPASLKNGIHLNKSGDFRYELVSSGINAAYIEFGTGIYYKQYESQLSEEWRVVASTFYKNGKGTMPQQPYFYPSIKRYSAIIEKEVKDTLKNI